MTWAAAISAYVYGAIEHRRRMMRRITHQRGQALNAALKIKATLMRCARLCGDRIIEQNGIVSRPIEAAENSSMRRNSWQINNRRIFFASNRIINAAAVLDIARRDVVAWH